MKKILEIKNLKVSIDNKILLNGLNLDIEEGTVCVVIGPNGAGKSTLANVIMGNPIYKVMSGKILFEGKDITKLSTEDRAKLGLFLSFQSPREISGVQFDRLLFESHKLISKSNKKKTLDVFGLKKKTDELCKTFNLPAEYMERSVNKGFSGGEKKKTEMIQLFLSDPKLAIFDEIDSGLDVDALESVANGIKKYKVHPVGMINCEAREGARGYKRPKKTALIITHYERVLKYIKTDKVAVLNNGKIAREGGQELMNQLTESGFKNLLEAKE